MQPQTVSEGRQGNRFERARESLWGAPGFQRRNSTIITPAALLLPQSSWIVETIRTDDDFAIFLQMIDQEGGQRLVLLQRVCKAIYGQHDSMKEGMKRWQQLQLSVRSVALSVS